MFTDAANETRPVGRNRRGFLKELGLGGIALTSLLADQPASGAVAVPGADLSEPLAPRQPHFAPKARNVIFLFMVGGASQLETFDHKPLLKKYAGRAAQDIFRQRRLGRPQPVEDVLQLTHPAAGVLLQALWPERRVGQRDLPEPDEGGR